MIRKNYQIAYKRVREELEKISAQGWTYEDLLKYGRLDKLQEKTKEILQELYRENNQEIKRRMRNTYLKTAMKTGNTLFNDEGMVKSIIKKLDVNKVINSEMAGIRWGERVNKRRADIIYQINREVRQGLYNGDTYSTVTKKLKDALGKDAPGVMQIARTETRRVRSVGQTDVVDEIAKKKKLLKTWLTMDDERVRASHESMDGVTIPYEQEFVTPLGSRGKAPMQLIGLQSASDNINCRCQLKISLAE